VTVEIPAEFHDLLSSTAIALVGTIGKRGEPQVTPLWFLWDGERVRLSLVDGRQKLRNLQRGTRRASSSSASPASSATEYGTKSHLVPLTWENFVACSVSAGVLTPLLDVVNTFAKTLR
jgi:Pyridoxamine 5'-phosphate oxidase